MSAADVGGFDAAARPKPWLREALGLSERDTPFPWQEELFARFAKGTIERSLDIPMGLGKTAVMAIWLVARAQGARLPADSSTSWIGAQSSTRQRMALRALRRVARRVEEDRGSAKAKRKPGRQEEGRERMKTGWQQPTAIRRVARGYLSLGRTHPDGASLPQGRHS